MKKKKCAIKIYSKFREGKFPEKQISYKYRNKKIDCEFNISYIRISFETSNLDALEKIFYRPVVKISLKISLLIYSLIYDEFFLYDSDKKYEVTFDNKSCGVDDVFPIYSMGSQTINLNFSYKDVSLNNIMTIAIKESDLDFRIVSLTDFIISKTKIFESERFLYLWMSMNGIYNYVWKEGHKKEDKKENKGRGTDSEKISYFAKLKKFYGVEFSREERIKLSNWIKSYLYTIVCESYGFTNFDESVYDTIERYVFQETGKKEKGKAFILFHFCYSVRCKLFHADTPAVLYCLGNDNDWKLLKTLNNMLESFLKEELSLGFNTDYLQLEDEGE